MSLLSTLTERQVEDRQRPNTVLGANLLPLPPPAPVFDVASLEGVEMIMGAVRLRLMDAHGVTQCLDLQPYAEAQISTALLTGHTSASGDFHERGPVIADDIRISTFIPPLDMQSSIDDSAMIEIQLTDKATLQVVLPLVLEQKLADRLLRRRDLRLESSDAGKGR